MYQEYENISCEEFRQLLIGINSNTPLGYTVGIRAEKNPKKIKEMTKKEKQIRADWLNFRNKQKKQERTYLKGKELTDMLSIMFG